MEITAEQLATMAGGRVEGNPDVLISSFSSIQDAKKGDVTFLANPKYEHFLYDTKASAVLVGENFVAEKPVNVTLIRVADAYDTLARLMKMVDDMKARPCGMEQPCFIAESAQIGADCYIGAFAYIGKNAKIGDNVLIYPQSYIGDGVTIGDGTIIRPGVKIYEGCRIGARCILHAGVVIGADGFGFAPTEHGYDKIPQTGNVAIADDVEIGANSTIDRATFGTTCVGKGTKIDNLVQIGHNVSVGEHNVFCAQTGVAGSTKIGDRNTFAGQVGLAGHLEIGSGNIVGAQSGVHTNMEDGERLLGYPAIDARQFARMQVYFKKLPELFSKKSSRK